MRCHKCCCALLLLSVRRSRNRGRLLGPRARDPWPSHVMWDAPPTLLHHTGTSQPCTYVVQLSGCCALHQAPSRHVCQSRRPAGGHPVKSKHTAGDRGMGARARALACLLPQRPRTCRANTLSFRLHVHGVQEMQLASVHVTTVFANALARPLLRERQKDDMSVDLGAVAYISRWHCLCRVLMAANLSRGLRVRVWVVVGRVLFAQPLTKGHSIQALPAQMSPCDNQNPQVARTQPAHRANQTIALKAGPSASCCNVCLTRPARHCVTNCVMLRQQHAAARKYTRRHWTTTDLCDRGMRHQSPPHGLHLAVLHAQIKSKVLR